jgi:glycosyltransferase involved in cell wall biosynthesis
MAKVAVVVTVLNEQGTIRSLAESLINQSIRPAEIVIVDGGSTDRTLEIIKEYKKIKVLKKPGNRSVGRNWGVANTKSTIIAFTDAGCVPHLNWIEELIKPFSNKQYEVVSGYYEGQASTIFQKCLVPFVLVMPDKLGSEFLPATRSMAITREAWNKSGGFEETLWHNEDFAFAHKIKKLNFNLTFAKNAVVAWIPRQNLRQAAWMFMRFAIGDIQAGILRPKVKMLAFRYYFFFFLLFVNRLALLLIIPYIIWAIGKNYKYVRHWRALYWLPILQLTADVCVLFGSVVGLLSRR